MLQDFCNVVGRENVAIPNPHERAWFRNVFTEPTGSLGQCEDTSAPLVTKAMECVALPSDFCEPASDLEESSATDISSCLLSSALLAMLVMAKY